MKNIKYGLIALTAIVAGTGSAFAVSASTESTNIIIGEPVSLEEAAELTKTGDSAGFHYPRQYAKCPRCTIYGKDAFGRFNLGHCKDRRVKIGYRHCQQRIVTA